MKILSIRLKNLASLAGEHVIDFESDPLASAGLIAIVGKTGAGKSTILDAMCLSLFNKVPRLKESDGKLQDVDGSELAVNSPMTVLRRGCGHAFAELCFVAPDQKRYLARWEVKRARENPTGKLQNVQRSLKCLTDSIVIADKIKAVDEQVKLITQLSFEQFTRAVLLAQSEVTAFLKARDNERGELLEYLTNSVIFGKIGELAYRKTADIAKQRKQLEDVLGHIEILNEDELQQLNQSLSTSNQVLKELYLEQKKLEHQQQWFQRQHKLQAELDSKQQDLVLQQQADQRLAADKLLRSQLDLCTGIRPVVLQKQQQFTQQQQLAPQLDQAQQSFAQLQQQFEQQHNSFVQAEKQLTQSQDFEQQYQPQLKQLRQCIDKRELIKEQYHSAKLKQNQLQQQQLPLTEQQQRLSAEQQSLERQLTQLSQQLQQSQQFQDLDTGLDAHIQQLQQFIPAYTKIEQSLGDLNRAEQQLQQQQQALTELQQQHGSVEQLEAQIEQQRAQREQFISLCTQLEQIQQQCQQQQRRETELKKLQQQLRQDQTQQQTLSDKISTAEQHYQHTKQQRMQLLEVLQQQRLLHTENIENLRADLKAGQPCVVCGSTEHPYRDHSEAVSKALFELQQQQLQGAETDEQQALQQWQALQQQASTCSASLTHTQKHIQALNTELEQLQQQLKQQLDTPAIQHLFSIQKTSQPKSDQEADQHSFEIEALLQQIEQAKLHSQQQAQHGEQQIKQATQACKDLQQTAQQLQQQHYALQQAKQLCAQIQHILHVASSSAAQPLSTQAQSILQTLMQRVQQLKQQQQCHNQQQQLLQELNRCAFSLDSLSTQIKALDQSLHEIEQQGQKNTELAIQQIQHMTASTVQKPQDWLQDYDAARQQTQQHYRQIKLSFDHLKQQHDQQKQALQQLQTKSLHHAQNVEHATTEIEHWLKQHPEITLADLEALLQISHTDEQQIRHRLKQLEQALTQAEAALKATQQQYDEHRLQQPEIDLETLNNSISSHEQVLAAQTEQRDQFKLKYELHQQSLHKQQQFMDQILEIQQQEHRWAKISALMGDSSGKKFRDIAQQYHLDILIEYANQQLSLLSQRYTLKRLENSLSLAIIDHDMDGEMRSVSSLSGGESFLTALALSLAIANMASGSMKIESLFIDEGFGTLDAASLHMVMNALDQLQSQGRKVVLISHISDMHERIPVQIQVNPRGAGASSIEIVG